MTDLQSKIQNATEGSRDLSDSVLVELGWRFKQYESRRKKVPFDWVTPDGKGIVAYGEQPDPSRNLQDAISLAGGWHLEISDDGEECGVLLHDGNSYHKAFGATKTGKDRMSLACCEAIVKAHEARKAEAA